VSEPHDSEIGGNLPPLDPELAAWLAADTPGPMPEAVWSGLEVALAAEPPLVPAGVVDLARERSRRRGRKALPILVGAAGVALVGAVVLPSLQTSSPAPVADGPSSAQPIVAAAPSPESPEVDNVAVAPAPATTDSANDPSSGTGNDIAPALPRAMVSTGTDYTAATLPAQVATLLASAGMSDITAVVSAMAASPSATVMPGSGLAATPESLSDCLKRLGLAPDSVPLVLDLATVDGRDGSVIVTAGARGADGRPTTLHVVAVGQDCTDQDVATARHLEMPLR
jgi:hypothetical protein